MVVPIVFTILATYTVVKLAALVIRLLFAPVALVLRQR